MPHCYPNFIEICSSWELSSWQFFLVGVIVFLFVFNQYWNWSVWSLELIIFHSPCYCNKKPYLYASVAQFMLIICGSPPNLFSISIRLSLSKGKSRKNYQHSVIGFYKIAASSHSYRNCGQVGSISKINATDLFTFLNFMDCNYSLWIISLNF